MLDFKDKIISENSPNKDIGRKGQKVIAFVIHRTDGSFESSFKWCLNKESKVSYHYIIRENGDIFCIVGKENTAWHAGLVKNATWQSIKQGINPNLYTIGIALSGVVDSKPSLEQIVSCGWLIRELAKELNITLDKNSVIPHNSIRADKVCPGLNVSVGDIIYLANLN